MLIAFHHPHFFNPEMFAGDEPGNGRKHPGDMGSFLGFPRVLGPESYAGHRVVEVRGASAAPVMDAECGVAGSLDFRNQYPAAKGVAEAGGQVVAIADPGGNLMQQGFKLFCLLTLGSGQELLGRDILADTLVNA